MNKNDRVKIDPNRKATEAAMRVVPTYKVNRRDLVDDNMRPLSLRNAIHGDNGVGGDANIIKREMAEQLRRVRDADAQMRLLPDLGMAEEILISGILAPTDHISIRLDVGCSEATPPGFLEAITKHFTHEFKYQTLQVDYMKQSLFRYGSVGLVPLPSTAISRMINQYETKKATSQQSGDINVSDLPLIGVLKKKGASSGTTQDDSDALTFSLTPAQVAEKANEIGTTLLSDYFQKIDGTKPSVRTVDTKDMSLGVVTLSDNALSLVIPKYKDAKKEAALDKALKDAYGLHGSVSQRVNDPYTRKVFKNKPIVHVDEGNSAEEEFDPIVIELRHDTMIPVYIPGKPKETIGCYVAIDPMTGYPVQMDSNINYFEELNRYMDQTALNRANTSGHLTYGSGTAGEMANYRVQYQQQMLEFYASQLDKELVASLSDNGDSNTVEVKCPEHLYRLMFARQLKNMNTTLIYIPASMMTYMAFEYDENGCGESLLKQTELYTSLRATLMFAGVTQEVRNAVPTRKLSITTDKNDPDKRGTIATVMNEYAKGQPAALILNKFRAFDIVDALNSAGILVQVDGGGYFPGTSISVDEVQRSLVVPDTGLDEKLRKLQYCGLSVTPEQVDSAFQGEFAAGIHTSNTIQAKKLMLYQAIHCKHSADFFKKYIWAGGPLYRELNEIYTKWVADTAPNKVGADGKPVKSDLPAFSDLIEGLFTSLPTPNTAVIKAQLEEFTQFRTMLNEALPQWLTPDMIKDYMTRENLSGSLDVGQRSIEACLLRRFMREHNMMPIIDDMLYDADGKLAKEIGAHNTTVMTTLANIIVETRSAEKIQEDLIDKLSERLGIEGDDTMGTSGSTDDSTDSSSAEAEELGMEALDNIDAEVVIDDGSGGEEGKADDAKPDDGAGETTEEPAKEPEEEGKPEEDKSVGPAE